MNQFRGRIKKELVFHIEANRQRLEYAIRTNNIELMFRIQSLLAQLHGSLFVQVRDESLKEEPMRTDLILLFSDAHPDGKVMTESEYYSYCPSMSREDFDTHFITYVSPEMREVLEAELERQNTKPVKKGA